MSSFVINPNKRDGYPSIDDNQFDFGPTQTSPYPLLFLYKDSTKLEGYPIMSSWKDPVPVQSAPYPAVMFGVDLTKMEGYPTFDSFGEFSPVQQLPYPRDMMGCMGPEQFDGYPTYRVKEFKMFGAFENALELKKITIAQSVKYIADYSFYNTGITKAVISRDCEYFEHSFPEGCVIEFYE